MIPDFTSRELGGTRQRCVYGDVASPTHWLEIELVGEDNCGIPYARYLVCLPSGEEVEGYLDEHGIARLENIATPGECKVCFTELDAKSWHVLAPDDEIL